MTPLIVVVSVPMGAQAVFVNGSLVLSSTPGSIIGPLSAVGKNIADALGVECFVFDLDGSEARAVKDESWDGLYERLIGKMAA
jgi:hypothetical protein